MTSARGTYEFGDYIAELVREFKYRSFILRFKSSFKITHNGGNWVIE